MITNSPPSTHLVLSHDRERPPRYGLSNRLETMPSSSCLTRDAEQLGSVAGVVLAEQDGGAGRDDAGELEPARIQRLGPERLAVEEQQVEGVEHRALGPVLIEVGLQFGER